MAGSTLGWMLLGLLQAAPLAPAATPATAPAAPDCTAAPYSDMAFWVGDWIVSDTRSASPVAESRIESRVDGCAVLESFSQATGPGGQAIHYLGTSLTAYDPATRTWRQFYVDSGGHASRFEGEATPGRIVLETHAGARTNRMTIEAQADGSVRQRGETRASDADAWTPGYDFTYRRK